jgi:hypothetical protein
MLAGCAAPGPDQGSALRNAVALDPCALLTSQQRGQLGLTEGAQQSDFNSHGESCEWGSRASADEDYLARLLTETATGGEVRPASATIGNRPTHEYFTSGTDPSGYCVFLVDLPPRRTLWVQYSDTAAPTLDHNRACQKARAAASAMVTTFTTLTW